MNRKHFTQHQTKKTLIHLLITAIFLISAQSSGFGQGIQVNGFARNYTGILLNDHNEYSIVQNTLDLDLSHSRDGISFKANPYLYHYYR